MQPNYLNRIVSGLLVCGLTVLLAGCGGSSSGRTFVYKPLPEALNTFIETSPDAPYSGQLYASSPTAGSTLSYGVDTKPKHGTLSIDQSTGAFTYTPDNGYQGADSFTYTAATANGSSAAASAVVLVNGGEPTVSAYGVPVYVHKIGSSNGPTSVAVDVRLSNPPNGQATVNYTTVDGTAKAGMDYTSESGTLTFGPGVSEQSITIPLSAVLHQSYRYFRLRLSSPSSNLKIGTDTANVVLRYWPEPLNDTGVTGCATYTNGNPINPITCPQADFPQQDADLGRDPDSYNGILAKVGYGGYNYDFGYDFTKVDFAGNPLFNQAAAYSVNPWSCVIDNWTGLEWEVPTTSSDSGLFDAGYIYSWYDPNQQTNGGNQGRPKGSAYKMDTYHFVQLANQAGPNQKGLCGHSDWRLPTAAELRNLFDVAAGSFTLLSPGGIAPIPTLNLGGYWTSISDPVYRRRAVVISSTEAYDSFLPKNGSTGIGGGYYVILVRGGEQ